MSKKYTQVIKTETDKVYAVRRVEDGILMTTILDKRVCITLDKKVAEIWRKNLQEQLGDLMKVERVAIVRL